jgi:hypothetical protein
MWRILDFLQSAKVNRNQILAFTKPNTGIYKIIESFQRFLLQVYYWKTVEKQETDPHLNKLKKPVLNKLLIINLTPVNKVYKFGRHKAF